MGNYLCRIGLNRTKDDTIIHLANQETLSRILEAQSRCIPFENFDVVKKGTISMSPDDVQTKLVDNCRGGYCFELNTLLKSALQDLGFKVQPLLCRVRWGKPDDSNEPNTGFTHLCLKVTCEDGSNFLADCGFAGINSIEPVSLDVGESLQKLPEGDFRVVLSKHKGFHVLELCVKEDTWRPLYEWRDEAAPMVDQIASNWFSCTFPDARFTNQLFACRVIGNTRHHILNNEYVIRKGHGVDKETITEKIETKERLLGIIRKVFEIKLEETDGIDRYL